VRREGADLGIAFDGDADRIGLVDASGEIVWGDHILILYARDVLARTGSGQSVIFDVKCSQALPDAVRAAGGVPVMWKTGHSLIKDKMKELHAPIAGEMSGHMFFDEGFYGHDDALYGAARLLRIVADSGMEVRDRRRRRPPLPRDARRGGRGRGARAVRRRLGAHPRVEHAARARDALRGADAGAAQRDPRRHGSVAPGSGRRPDAGRGALSGRPAAGAPAGRA
jgi:hypothetical protein